MKTISILIPCFNEQAVLTKLYERLTAVINPLSTYNWEIMFINDGSTDNTLDIIKQLQAVDSRIAYITLSRNFGKEAAMSAGFDYASGDAAIIIDADLQDPPELIPQMIAEWKNGYDDVYAQRLSRQGESFFKKASSYFYYRLLAKSTNIPIQIDVGDFRLLDRKCIDALKSMHEAQRYTKGMYSWIGYRKKAIPFERPPRAAGKSKWSYLQLTNLAIEGITSFTTVPLRLSSLLGITTSCGAFLYMLWVIFRTLVFGEAVQGYPSLICILLFVSGIQLTVLGIIGEYLGRVFNESKQRPVYLIDEYNKKTPND